MKPHYLIYTSLLLVASAQTTQAQTAHTTVAGGRIGVDNVSVRRDGNDMLVRMSLKLDSLRMPANRRIVLTPSLAGSTDSIGLPPIVINGRRQHIMYLRRDHRQYDTRKANVVRRDGNAPQTMQYTATVPYAEWMGAARLAMDEDLCGCGRTEPQQQTTLKRMYTPQCAYISPVATASKTYQMHGRAYIDFPVNRTELHPDYRNNPRELQKIIDTINIVRRDTLVSITNIDIHGYASPESPYDHNAWLAENRAATLKNYVRKLMQMDDRLFTVHYTAEDWDGLRAQLAKSDLPNRDAILNIAADETIDPDRREWLIKSQYPDEYRTMLATWYPALRHSDYVITCDVRPFTADEARRLIRTRPELLSQNEMFLAAQACTPGSDEFNSIMQTTAMRYPDDPTANLNAACARLADKQYEAAKPYLDKAGQSAEADNARGVYAWATGDEAAARQWFAKAARKGCATAQKNLDNI